MVTKTKNPYRWDIDKDINYFFEAGDGFKYHDQLREITELLPQARAIVERVNLDIVKECRKYLEESLSVLDPEGVDLTNEYSCRSLFDNSEQSDAILLKNVFSGANLSRLNKAFDTLDKHDLKIKYKNDVEAAAYLRMLEFTVKKGRGICHREGRVFNSEWVTAYNRLSPEITLKELAEYSGKVVDQNWFYIKERQPFFRYLGFNYSSSMENQPIVVNNSIYCASLSKFNNYLKMIGPTLIAATVYPELIESVNSTRPYPTMIDFLNNIMKLRCAHNTDICKEDPLKNILENTHTRTLSRSDHSYNGVERKHKNALAKIARTNENKIISIIAADLSFNIAF